MKYSSISVFILLMMLAACASQPIMPTATETYTPTSTAVSTATETAMATVAATETPAFPKIEITTNPDQAPTITYDQITSGALAYWERQKINLIQQNVVKGTGWMAPNGDKSLIFTNDHLQLASISKISGDFEGLPDQQLYVVGIQVPNKNGSYGLIHVLTKNDSTFKMSILLDALTNNNKQLYIVSLVDEFSVMKYKNDKELGWGFLLDDTEGTQTISSTIKDLQSSGNVSSQMEDLLYIITWYQKLGN